MNPLQRLLARWTFLRWLALLALLAGSASSALATKAYLINTDGTVTDPTTGLTWMRCSMGQTWSGTTCTGTASAYSWAQAMALPGTQTYAGQSDWRLPNIRELHTIVDRAVVIPTIDLAVFPNTPATSFWTSTVDARSTNPIYSGYVWFVSFFYGTADGGNQNSTLARYQARLVRGGQPGGLLDVARPNIDYVDQGDGTLRHIPTGLVWQRCTHGESWTGTACFGSYSTVTWDAAKLLTSDFAGKTDWRLPTQDELLGLVDYLKKEPAINRELFATVDASNFWSSTVSASFPDSAWSVYASYGYSSDNTKNNAYRVRLVRSGRAFGLYPLTVNKTGTGQVHSSVTPGIECGTVCTGGYNPGDVVTLNASPAANLIGWGGACASAGTAATCTVTMNAAKTVSASFSNPQLILQSGWSLMGNGQNQPMGVSLMFDDTTIFTSVWKWDAVNSVWHFYAPGMSPADLQTYANSKGYVVLTTINPGEGFWVNALQSFAITFPAGAALASADFAPGQAHALRSGWNLAAIDGPVTPRVFNLALGAARTAGVVPGNLASLWAWDNLDSKWVFYAPALEAQGIIEQFNYATSKGYLDFHDTGKALTNGMGFWVNKP